MLNIIEVKEQKFVLVPIEQYHSDNDTWRKLQAKESINTLTHSELKVAERLFENFREGEVNLVKLSSELNISESVSRSLLRKLEANKIVEKRSLGRNGTYINLLNKEFRNLLIKC